MTENKFKNIILGISTIVGIIVAGGVYATGMRAADKPKLIGELEAPVEEETVEKK